MKKLLILFLLSTQVALAQENTNIVRAKAMLEELRKNNYKAIVAQFDTFLAARLDTARLRKSWISVQQQFGGFKSVSGIDTSRQTEYEVVIQHLEMEKRKIDLKIVYGKSGAVKGFNLQPTSAMRAPYKTPDYAQADLMDERLLKVTSGSYTMSGILTVPKGPARFPIVILVHGTGPNDKDETVGSLKIFKDFSYGLTPKGIAVFRFDKRARVYGQKSMRVKNFTVREEMIDDVLAAIEAVKADPSVDTNKIFLCGHSYGAMMLPKIAAEVKVAGLIYLAVNAKPLEDIMLDQAEILREEASNPREKALVDTMKKEAAKIKAMKQNPPSVNDSNTFLLRYPVSFWFDLSKYDAIKAAQKLKLPMIFLHGDRDYQVAKSDFTTWKTAIVSKNASFKSYPDLNHFFMKGVGKSSPEEYNKPANVSIQVIQDISTWIKAVK